MVAGRNLHGVNLPYPWIDGLTRRQQEQLRRDFEAVAAQGAGTRWATIVIAASDSDAIGKSTADYVCPGSADQAKINAAITALEARGTPGRIVLLEGTYHLSATISIQALGSKQLSIVGMGGAGAHPGITGGNTVLDGTGLAGTPAITIGGSQFGGTNVILRDLTIIHTGGAGGCISCQDASLELTGAYLQYAGTTGYALNQNSSLGSDESTVIRDCVIRSTGSGGSGMLVTTGPFTASSRCSIVNNVVRFVGAGTGIEFLNKGTSVTIVDNDVRGSTNASGTCIQTDGNSQNDNIIASNVCKTAQYGIQAAGFENLIIGNMIDGCTNGIRSRPFEMDHTLITGNNILGATSGVVLDQTCDTNTVAFNKIVASGAAVTVGASCTNTGVFYNDTYGSGSALSDSGTATRTEGWFLTAAGLPIHHTRHETGGADAITGSVDGNARVAVRKNTAGATVSTRRRINFIEGANMAITLADDSINEEIDVTLAVSGIAGTTTFKNNGSTVGAESTLNVIPGSNITIGMTDTGSAINLTITAAAGPGNAGKVFNYLALR